MSGIKSLFSGRSKEAVNADLDPQSAALMKSLEATPNLGTEHFDAGVTLGLKQKKKKKKSFFSFCFFFFFFLSDFFFFDRHWNLWSRLHG